MKKLLGIVVLSLLWCSNSFADVENWEIEKILDNKFISVSTHGTVTHGDKYRLLISTQGKCDVVEDTVTFYTMANHPEILNIVNKKIGLEAFENKMLADIKSSSKFLGGHMVWITNGLYKIDDHIKFLQDKDELNVKLMIVFKNFEKKTFWKAEDMFDIDFNNWKLKNVSEALKEGQKLCLEK